MGLLDTLQGVYNNGAPVRKGLLDLLTGKANVGGLLGDITALNNADYVNKLSQLSKGKFDPQNDQTAQFAMGMNPMMALHTVWHGTPHTFGKFDMSKLGTGEGAQQYGHGLYFAENPEVAKSYSPRDYKFEDKISRLSQMAERQNNYPAMEVYDRYLTHEMPHQVEEYLTQLKNERYSPKELQQMMQAHDMASKEFAKQKGSSIYKVDIPDDVMPKMLDWDKKISEQPHLLPIYDSFKNSDVGQKLMSDGNSFDLVNGGRFGNGLTGQDFHGLLYESYANKNGGEAAKVADWLKSNGIPGIKYLDQNSRSGSGTNNYVLFDDNLPKILERNGVPLK